MNDIRSRADEILAGAGIGKPEIEASGGPSAIRALRQAIDTGVIPDTYVSGGRVIHVEQVSGTVSPATGKEDAPVPVSATGVGPDELAELLARHTFTFTLRTRKGAAGGEETFPVEVTPPRPILAAALAPKTWPRLRPLHGIVGAPVLRPDGSLLQQPGYDPLTGLYLASKVPLGHVPERPTAAQVRAALEFLLGLFLRDFPWIEPADLANYIALLVTPILRGFLRTLIPFGVISSTTQGSGKTILACGLGMLYGQRVLTWTYDDQELRKAITSVLADPVGTVVFDNLAEGSLIRSPVLARLITDRTWADRLLGKNATAAFQNDRVWVATGNNLRVGGDMVSRTVLVRINPDVPHPEERTGFAIPGLDQWILNPENQRTVLRHLLVLVMDWTSAGAPRRQGVVMRQFTPWAEAVAGFLAHHGIEGFLGNVQALRDIDDEDTMWAGFLGQWRRIHADRWVTTHELRLSADPAAYAADPWDGLFLAGGSGKLPSEVSLGKKLTGQVDRYHGRYVLRSSLDRHAGHRVWRVEEWSGSSSAAAVL